VDVFSLGVVWHVRVLPVGDFHRNLHDLPNLKEVSKFDADEVSLWN